MQASDLTHQKHTQNTYIGNLRGKDMVMLSDTGQKVLLVTYSLSAT